MTYLGGLLGGILRSNLLVLSESLSLRRSTHSTVGSGSHTNNSGVDSTRHTVVQLVVQLGKSVFLVHRSLGQVSDGSGLNHVSDSHTLDGLVLWHTSGTVKTTHGLDVSSTLLVSSVRGSLLWHVLAVSIWIRGQLNGPTTPRVGRGLKFVERVDVLTTGQCHVLMDRWAFLGSGGAFRLSMEIQWRTGHFLNSQPGAAGMINLVILLFATFAQYGRLLSGCSVCTVCSSHTCWCWEKLVRMKKFIWCAGCSRGCAHRHSGLQPSLLETSAFREPPPPRGKRAGRGAPRMRLRWRTGKGSGHVTGHVRGTARVHPNCLVHGCA